MIGDGHPPNPRRRVSAHAVQLLDLVPGPPSCEEQVGEMSVIPCRRPKTRIDVDDLNRATCLVPGCTWTYGPGLKTDVEQSANWHRREHRDAVPEAVISYDHLGHWVECACGIRRRQSTKADALSWRTYHLTHDHGLVTCP